MAKRDRNAERRTLKRVEKREQRNEELAQLARLKADSKYAMECAIISALSEEQFPGFSGRSYKNATQPSFQPETGRIRDSVQAFTNYNRSNGNSRPVAFSYNGGSVAYVIREKDSMGEYTVRRVYDGRSLVEAMPSPSTPARIRGIHV